MSRWDVLTFINPKKTLLQSLKDSFLKKERVYVLGQS